MLQNELNEAAANWSSIGTSSQPKKDSKINSHHLDEVHDHSTNADLIAHISAWHTQVCATG